MKKKTYKIIRFFNNAPNKVILTGLTLEEAQEHCKNPETSSRTATGLVEHTLTRNLGQWFDGYEEEN